MDNKELFIVYLMGLVCFLSGMFLIFICALFSA